MSSGPAVAASRSRGGVVHGLGLAVFGAVLLLLALHAAGVGLDFAAAVRSPLELDYGEGIVWQQAVLIPGPRMYPMGQDLPFIVFHYPPLYHLITRAVAPAMPDMLAAGRLVSELASGAIALLVAGLVLVATPASAGRQRWMPVAIAVLAGLLALCMHAVRSWGMVMRVDMVAIALGLAGVLVAARADGRLWGTAAGLLLCVAAVYTKQTQLPAGVAIFCVALARRPRAALGAAAIAGGVGLAVLAGLQWQTGGGFLHNIVGYNINRLSLRHAYWVFFPERYSLPFMALMAAAGVLLLRRLWQPGAGVLPWLRGMDRVQGARAMLLLHFGLAGLMVVTAFKSGGYYNYLLDVLCVGCVLIGVWLNDLRTAPAGFLAASAVLAAGVLLMPMRQMPDREAQADLDRAAVLQRRVAEAALPVASENMTLLMQAGKDVVYEPAIAAELASLGGWDETPLVDMIRRHGFAFMITTGNTSRSTPAMDAAMREAYPRVEQLGPKLFVNLPAETPAR